MKNSFKLCGKDIAWMNNEYVSNYLKSISINTPTVNTPKPISNMPQLYISLLVALLEAFDNPLQYKMAIPVGFLCFLAHL